MLPYSIRFLWLIANLPFDMFNQHNTDIPRRICNSVYTTKTHLMTQKYHCRTVADGVADGSAPTAQPIVACTQDADGRYRQHSKTFLLDGCLMDCIIRTVQSNFLDFAHPQNHSHLISQNHWTYTMR